MIVTAIANGGIFLDRTSQPWRHAGPIDDLAFREDGNLAGNPMRMLAASGNGKSFKGPRHAEESGHLRIQDDCQRSGLA